MATVAGAAASVPLRPPGQVMRLARMGAFHATRLSFLPTLLRRMAAERWRIAPSLLELDGDGYGRAVYRAATPDRVYSLVAFSLPLDPERRSDRVIADAWDATFCLYDGEPSADDLERLAVMVPRQEAGRFRPTELVLSRANRSVRMFDHVVGRLAAGGQPDLAALRSVGYLMRTTAVYGNGKFGIADRDRIAGRPAIGGPFGAEMLTVYLIRCFTHDLVEHVARSRGGSGAAPLGPASRRHLGVGNATGLGMAPFLVSHPVLLHRWMTARETALARVRSVPARRPGDAERLAALMARARTHADQWTVADARQAERIERLRADLAILDGWGGGPDAAMPWDGLYRRAEAALHPEAQEMLVSLLLELRPDLVDPLAGAMGGADRPRLDPAMTLDRLRDLVDSVYGWALAIDFDDAAAGRRFWYVSEEKQEPRLGDRETDPGVEPGGIREMPLAVAREVQGLASALEDAHAAGEGRAPVATLLMRRADLRHVVRRVQTVAGHPYGEIRDNLVSATFLPLDLLRCKLSFFGAARFDPKSDRWTRITLCQGAPLPADIAAGRDDDGALFVAAA